VQKVLCLLQDGQRASGAKAFSVTAAFYGTNIS